MTTNDIVEELLGWKDAAKRCAVSKDQLIRWHLEAVDSSK